MRTALSLRQPELAKRLVEAVEPRTPLGAHALCAGRAQLTEAAEQQIEAAALYAEATERWLEFGNVPERAYALLGQGRCLSTNGDATAEHPLLEARKLFASMGFAPAVANRRPPGVARGCGSVATTAPTEPRHAAKPE